MHRLFTAPGSLCAQAELKMIGDLKIGHEAEKDLVCCVPECTMILFFLASQLRGLVNEPPNK